MVCFRNGSRRALLLLLAAQAPAGDATVAVRAGNHADFGRLVFDTPANTRYTVARDGDRVLIRFAPDIVLSEPPFLPRNVSRLRTARGQVEFTIPPGATLRRMRLGERVVIDITDPPPVVAPVAPTAEQPVSRMPMTAAASPPLGPVTAAASPPLGPVTTAVSPPLGKVAMEQDVGLVIPAGQEVGAAMFRRGAVTYVAFDTAFTFDQVQAPAFAAVSMHVLPDATVLRLVPPDGRSVSLTRAPNGWRMDAVAQAGPVRPIPAHASGHQLVFDAPAIGQVLSIADPDNGAPLLIGTQRAPGTGISGERRTADFVLLRTEQGLVIEALSDRVTLRAIAGGFVLNTPAAETR